MTLRVRVAVCVYRLNGSQRRGSGKTPHAAFLMRTLGGKKKKKELIRHWNLQLNFNNPFHTVTCALKELKDVCLCVCVPHILLDVLAPEVYLLAVVPAPAAPLGLLISKPEAVAPPVCNGTSSYGQSVHNTAKRVRPPSGVMSPLGRAQMFVDGSLLLDDGHFQVHHLPAKHIQTSPLLLKLHQSLKTQIMPNHTSAQRRRFTFQCFCKKNMHFFSPRQITKDVRSQTATRTVRLCFLLATTKC